MNVKGNRHVVTAEYKAESTFKIPDGVDLNDKNVVAEWGIKWDKLHITYTDGRYECIEPTIPAENYFKYAWDYKIEKAENIGFEYEEDEEPLSCPFYDYCKKKELEQMGRELKEVQLELKLEELEKYEIEWKQKLSREPKVVQDAIAEATKRFLEHRQQLN